MKCSILVLYRLVIGTVLYFVSAWVVYYWFVIGRLRVRLACAKTTKSSGKSNRFLILIYCGEYSLLKIATKSDLKAAVNEIHDATVVFDLNSLATELEPASLTFTALIYIDENHGKSANVYFIAIG